MVSNEIFPLRSFTLYRVSMCFSFKPCPRWPLCGSSWYTHGIYSLVSGTQDGEMFHLQHVPNTLRLPSWYQKAPKDPVYIFHFFSLRLEFSFSCVVDRGGSKPSLFLDYWHTFNTWATSTVSRVNESESVPPGCEGSKLFGSSLVSVLAPSYRSEKTFKKKAGDTSQSCLPCLECQLLKAKFT